jgi:threonine dehydratase
VSHGRIGSDLGVDEVDIVLQLETRGSEHCDQLVHDLRTAGYDISLSSEIST